jgi:hypothetical protein
LLRLQLHRGKPFRCDQRQKGKEAAQTAAYLFLIKPGTVQDTISLLVNDVQNGHEISFNLGKKCLGGEQRHEKLRGLGPVGVPISALAF